MSFETTALFNGTVSFRDKSAAGKFLDSLGTVVEQSVKVFHAQTSNTQTLQNELHNVGVLLHHFEDSLEGDAEARERDIVQGASAAAAERIREVLGVLRSGPAHGSSWSDSQRDAMASSFKDLFEHLVVLMQMSEFQQSKSVIKNIRLTQQMVGSVYANTGRAAHLHNNNLRNAIPVLVRAAGNRSEVSQDPVQKELLADIRSHLSREGSMFNDWIDANQDATEVAKRARGKGLEEALGRLFSAVEVRIVSSADFGYKYLNRRKIDSTIDDLLNASKSGNKAEVLQAAKALTEVVKEVEAKDLDEDTTLKQDTRALLEQAKLALDGTDNQLALEASASRMKKEVAHVAEKEQQIKGKPLFGTLPAAIQSMAALLKTNEARQAKPKEASGGSVKYGEKKEAPKAKEELPDHKAPGVKIIHTMNEKNKY